MAVCYPPARSSLRSRRLRPPEKDLDKNRFERPLKNVRKILDTTFFFKLIIRIVSVTHYLMLGDVNVFLCFSVAT